MSWLDDVKGFARFATGLNRFLRHPLTPAECQRRLTAQHARRAESFLKLLERGIYGQPGSPYRKLLHHAGWEFAAVGALVAREGVEGALEKLHEDGVYITLDEFKGRRSIRRGKFELATTPGDFDNPLASRDYEGQTGGSRGLGRRVVIDFDLLTHEAAYHQVALTAFGLADRPISVWRPVPLVSTGMVAVLRYMKLGKRVEHWFSPTRFTTWKYALFTRYATAVGRLPSPEYVPVAQAGRVARWLADKRAAGTPGVLSTNASGGVRVCLAARRAELDIAGSFFFLGGEPYTAAKAHVITAAGCRAACQYSMAEIGNIGLACANPVEPDEVHLMTDKVAVIQRPVTVRASGVTVPALVYTTVLPSCPKLMLNVESDDYAVVEERMCGCPFGVLGFHRHARRIRSYEKLCSEAVTFLGTELIRLVEEVLPAAFGGSLADYQFVEEEEGGLPKVSLVVSPGRGELNHDEILATVYRVLRTYPGGEVMAGCWQEGQTVRVVRREPTATGAAKILPLHIQESQR